jgi:hypothetical protein
MFHLHQRSPWPKNDESSVLLKKREEKKIYMKKRQRKK